MASDFSEPDAWESGMPVLELFVDETVPNHSTSDDQEDEKTAMPQLAPILTTSAPSTSAHKIVPKSTSAEVNNYDENQLKEAALQNITGSNFDLQYTSLDSTEEINKPALKKCDDDDDDDDENDDDVFWLHPWNNNKQSKTTTSKKINDSGLQQDSIDSKSQHENDGRIVISKKGKDNGLNWDSPDGQRQTKSTSAKDVKDDDWHTVSLHSKSQSKSYTSKKDQDDLKQVSSGDENQMEGGKKQMERAKKINDGGFQKSTKKKNGLISEDANDSGLQQIFSDGENQRGYDDLESNGGSGLQQDGSYGFNQISVDSINQKMKSVQIFVSKLPCFMCDPCRIWFVSKQDLQKHVQKSHQDNANKDESLQNNSTGSGLEGSLDSNNNIDLGEDDANDVKMNPPGKQSFECKKCTVRFSKKSLLLKHTKAVHGDLDSAGNINQMNDTNDKLNGRNKELLHKQVSKVKAKNDPSDEIVKSKKPRGIDDRGYKEQKSKRKATNSQETKPIQNGNSNPSESPLLCRYCMQQSFSKLSGLLKHIHKMHKDKRYQCTMCNKTFERSRHRKAHYTISHARSGDFKCRHCDKSFGRKELLQSHEKVHEETSTENQTQCKVCHKECTCTIPVDSHKVVKQEKFKCKRCDKVYLSKPEFKKHYWSSHAGETSTPIQPEKCLTKSPTPTIFTKDGPQTSINQKSFKCTTCPKQFARKSALLLHEKHHSGVKKDHKCEFCGEDFISSQDLTVHRWKHTSAWPYKCMYCGKHFLQQATFFLHMDVHTTENKPCFCALCGAKFYGAEQLEKHRKVHATELPYLCQHCPKQFPELKDLKKHMMEPKHKDIKEEDWGLEQCYVYKHLTERKHVQEKKELKCNPEIA